MPDKQDIGEFTKQVAQQLKAGHKVDAEFVSKAVDKHDQDKGIIKVGDSELWLRYGDDGVMVDKIKDGKSVWNVKVDSPICHLRTSKSIVDKQAEKDVAEGVIFGDEAKTASEASIRAMKHIDEQEVAEGLSHDSSIERKLRKTIKQIHHQKGDDKIRIPHPEDVGIIKRDKSEKDARIKSRQANEDIAHKILQLLDGNTQILAESTTDELGFMLRVVDRMGNRLEADKTKILAESINLAIANRKTDDVAEIERFITCLREKKTK